MEGERRQRRLKVANIVVVSWSRMGPKKEQFSTVSTHTHTHTHTPTDRLSDQHRRVCLISVII